MLESSVKSSVVSATLRRMMTHLPAARTSNNPHTLSGRDLERDVVQDLWAILRKCCQNMTQHVVSELTGEYRAESLSTTRCPLAGQYAGGTPSAEGFGSCSMERYCCMRSKLWRKLQHLSSCPSLQLALTCCLRTTESRLEQLPAIHYYKHTVNLEGVEDPDHGEYHPTERGCGAVIQMFCRDSETRRIWTHWPC